jgi:5-(carboxyamino)imidazole ribonucleotide mutase
MSSNPSVLVVMGSKSDLPIAEKCIGILKEFGVTYQLMVCSAHRTPEELASLVKGSKADVFIAIAGLSAALPGAIAAHTLRPVIGVPVSGKVNLDSILSIVQMPPGIPVGAVGLDMGENAGILAAQILAVNDHALLDKLKAHRARMREKILKDSEETCSKA